MRRRPQALGAVLPRVQQRLAPPDLLADVQQRWRDAVGEELAREAWPEAERGGVVTIRCSSAVWAAELTMLAGTLLEQVNERLDRGRQAVALKFTAGPSTGRFAGSPR